jgi:hypothetical protein
MKKKALEMKKDMVRPSESGKNNPTIYLRVAGGDSPEKRPTIYLRVAGGVLLHRSFFGWSPGLEGMAWCDSETGGGDGSGEGSVARRSWAAEAGG